MAKQTTASKSTSDKPRKLKVPLHKSFKLEKRVKIDARLPGAFQLFRSAIGTLRRHWKIFLGISLIYGLLNVLLVQGFSAATDLTQLKQNFDSAISGNLDKLSSVFTLFVYLLGTSGSQVSPTSGAYQFLLTLMVSLALIWALRQAHAGIAVRIRDAFYRGMYPLVPLLLVLVVIGLELIPFVVGLALYTTVTGNGLAVSATETILWAVVFGLLSLLTIYLVCSSLFALYISCLPDMTPMRALRSARELVRYRRFAVVRKIIFLPIALFLLAAIIIIPLIMFATPVAPWAFIIMSMLFLAVIHSYLYGLYRALL